MLQTAVSESYIYFILNLQPHVVLSLYLLPIKIMRLGMGSLTCSRSRQKNTCILYKAPMLFILISWATWSSREVKREEKMRIILGIDRLSGDTEMCICLRILIK
jgi:hypothetical protein